MPDLAAIGFRTHSGWAAAISLGGDPFAPSLLDRRRIELHRGRLPWEPYHDAARAGGSSAEQFIAEAAEFAHDLASRALSEIATALSNHEARASCVVIGPSRPPRDLAAAISSHPAMHNAEGWFFREAIMSACEAKGLAVIGTLEREAYDDAASAAGLRPDRVRQYVGDLKHVAGPPWTSDYKTATAAAWLALARLRES